MTDASQERGAGGRRGGPVGGVPPRVWVEAARPRTLPASVVPVLVGAAAAGSVIWWRFAAALVVSLALQVAVNYANDYFDGVRGVDTAARVGPRRAVAAGLVTPAAMRNATVAAMAVAGVAGLALAVAAGWQLLVVGVLSVGAAAGYSGGPRPYASAGLGEVFVFVFFGLVATVGTAYVQVERLGVVPFVAAVPVGLLAVAILVVNNLRDIPTDAVAGKRTLAVRLGDAGTRRFYTAVVLGALLALPPLAAVARNAMVLAALVVVAPAALGAVRTVRAAGNPRELIAALGRTAQLQLLLGVSLATALWIG